MADTSFVPGRYFSRSWAMLTQDKGWIKPVLLLALCMAVPIAGPIAVAGYVWDWARLTAWGIDSAPKQRGVSVGGCFKAGWRVVVVGLVWGIAISVLFGLVSALGEAVGGGIAVILGLASFVGAVLLELVLLVAQMRATIYERIGPGFGVPQVFHMAGRDFGGLMRILGIELLGGLVEWVIGLVVGICVFASLMPVLFDVLPYAFYLDEPPYYLAGMVASAFATALPVTLLFGYLMSFVGVLFNMVAVNALGLWVRQFDVPAWGEPSDPVPAPVPPADPYAGAWPYAPQPPAQSQSPFAPQAPAEAAAPVQPAMAANPMPSTPDAPPTGPCTPAGAPAPVVYAQPEVTGQAPAQGTEVGGYQSSAQATEEVPTMDYTVANDGQPVVPPTQQDAYQSAPERVTSWTSVVEPKDDAVDHMAYSPDPTEPPAPADDHGVTPPTVADIYQGAAERVAGSPEVSLDNASSAAQAEVASEGLAARPDDAVQTPVVPPTPADIHVTAADAEVSWTSVVEPKDDAVDHMAYSPDPTEPPAPADDHGVTPPTVADIYQGAAERVAGSPEVGVDDSAVSAESELIADDLAAGDPAQAPVVEPADGAPVPPYMAPAGDNGTSPEPIVTPLTKREEKDQ